MTKTEQAEADGISNPELNQNKDVIMDGADQGQDKEQENEPIAEESEKEEIRRVMFETDNWEDCITNSVWFGQKIPQKRRFYGRGAQNTKD